MSQRRAPRPGVTDLLVKRRQVQQAVENAQKMDPLRLLYVAVCKSFWEPRGFTWDKRGRMVAPAGWAWPDPNAEVEVRA